MGKIKPLSISFEVHEARGHVSAVEQGFGVDLSSA